MDVYKCAQVKYLVLALLPQVCIYTVDFLAILRCVCVLALLVCV